MRALEVVGDIPVLHILERAFLGRHQFGQFVTETGIARSIVSNRLNKLVDAEILRRGPQRSSGYHLTEKGRGLFPVALMILRWQHRWAEAGQAFQIKLVHTECRHEMVPVAACDDCLIDVDAREVSWEPGPGLSQTTPLYTRRRQQTASARAKRGNLTPLDTVFDLFGDRWAALVVRACFTGINRFDDIQRDTLMASNILSDRLERLKNRGIIRAVPYGAHRYRYEYRLTEKGRDFYPVLLTLLQWGEQWYADKKGPPYLLHHQTCNHALRLRPICCECRTDLHSGNIAFALQG